MDIFRNMKYLQETAKTQSINKAADNLFISKSSLSDSLRNLEEELGVSLLNRSVHGVSLTKAGEMVVKRSSLIFNIMDEIRDECHKYNETYKKINFFMEGQFANAIFPHILKELNRFDTKSYITTESVLFEEILKKVSEHSENIGLVFSNTISEQQIINNPMYDELIYKHINSYYPCVVTAKYSKHVSLNVTDLTYADIEDIPQIELKQNHCMYKMWDTTNMLLKRNYVMSTDNSNIFFEAILNDIGIGVLLEIAIPFGLADRNKIRIVPLKDCKKMDLWMIYNKNNDQSSINQLYNIIKNATKPLR